MESRENETNIVKPILNLYGDLKWFQMWNMNVFNNLIKNLPSSIIQQKMNNKGWNQ